MSKKPVRLKQIETKHRVFLWASIGLAVMLIAVGWTITVKQVLNNDIIELRSQLDTSIERAAETVTNVAKPTKETALEEVDKFKENLDIFYQAAEDVRAGQQAVEAQETEQPEQDSVQDEESLTP